VAKQPVYVAQPRPRCVRFSNIFARMRRLDDYKRSPLEHLDLKAEISRLYDDWVGHWRPIAGNDSLGPFKAVV
jgi:hypothetical protein